MLVVLDTNIIVSALRSRDGASFAILDLVASGDLQVAISPALILEYEEVLRRSSGQHFTNAALERALDELCSIGKAFTRVRRREPLVADLDDQMMVDLARASDAEFIVTHNIRDFAVLISERFRVIRPAELLRILRDQK